MVLTIVTGFLLTAIQFGRQIRRRQTSHLLNKPISVPLMGEACILDLRLNFLLYKGEIDRPSFWLELVVFTVLLQEPPVSNLQP